MGCRFEGYLYVDRWELKVRVRRSYLVECVDLYGKKEFSEGVLWNILEFGGR